MAVSSGINMSKDKFIYIFFVLSFYAAIKLRVACPESAAIRDHSLQLHEFYSADFTNQESTLENT